MAQKLEIQLLTDIASSLGQIKKFQQTTKKAMKSNVKETKKLNKTLTKTKVNLIALNSTVQLAYD